MTWDTEPDLQATSCSRMFSAGFRLQIPGRTIILLVNLGIEDLERGGFRVTPTQSGNRLVKALSYGSAENVSILWLYSFLKLMITVFPAGAGKSVIWYDKFSTIRFESLCRRPVLPSSRTSAPCRNLGSRRLHSSILTLGTIKRRIS